MIFSTRSCAAQHDECCAEDSVEIVSTFRERNLLVRLIIPPAVDTVEDVVITALNIDRVSTTIALSVLQLRT